MSIVRRYLLLLIAWAALGAPVAFADSAAGDAWLEAHARGTAGPATIALGSLATLRLPKDFLFVPPDIARRLSEGLGTGTGDPFLGVIIPAERGSNWFITLATKETGAVDLAAVKALDPEMIRGALAVAIRAGNEARRLRGADALDAGALLVPLSVDVAHSRVTTAIRVYDQGPTSGGDDHALVTSLLFGQTHAVTLALATDLSEYDHRRRAFDALVEAVSLREGGGPQPAERNVPAAHLADLLFGGRSFADIDREVTDRAAEMQRIAAIPPSRPYFGDVKLALYGLLACFAVLIGTLAFRRRGSNDGAQMRSGGIDRVLRPAPKRP